MHQYGAMWGSPLKDTKRHIGARQVPLGSEDRIDVGGRSPLSHALQDEAGRRSVYNVERQQELTDL